MDYDPRPRGAVETALFDLRRLFEQYGYARYRVSQFEEYDLYARNRSFITGSSILTFTDTDGCLRALKPDVTLSIIKNAKLTGSVTKVYYNESVYRAADPMAGFTEIQQTGLECLGELDLYCVCEVMTIAARSLEALSDKYILDISHMGLLAGFLTDIGAPTPCREELLRLAGEKNTHEAARVARENGLSPEHIETFHTLIRLRAGLREAVGALTSLPLGESAGTALRELTDIAEALGGRAENMYLDLSLQCDPHYYNGVVFKGFLPGIPSAILSGGRYDGLVHRLGRDAGAMGFAVYLNLLERWGEATERPDADVLILDEGADAGAVLELANCLITEGQRVRVDRAVPEGFRCGKILHISKEGPRYE